MKMKVFFAIGIVLTIITSLIYFNVENKQQEFVPKELDNNQIVKMIQLGLIEIHPDLPHNTNDKNLKLNMRTQQGVCKIHQDILGRYYCRW